MVVGSEDHDRRARRRRVRGARCCRSAARAPAAARRLRCSDAPVRLVRPRMHDRRWISRRRPRRLRYTLGAVLRTRISVDGTKFSAFAAALSAASWRDPG